MEEDSELIRVNSVSFPMEYFNKSARCCSLISTSAGFFFKIDGASRSRMFNALCSCFLLIGLRNAEVDDVDVEVDVELDAEVS